EADAAFGGEGDVEGEFSGRCSAILSNGKRCPNEALPGTRYCGLPAHQALEGQEPAVAEAVADATAEEAEELAPVAVEGTEEEAFEAEQAGATAEEEQGAEA